ncbi:carbohydrate ABC transporter permease [Paenibacillus aquistagni]|uniref:Carbohydrate ABC transporter membrane protein 2, CUT1 family n=1 Tax=Paenibacillus aquistagni TaxID=1852522 RepID=A0A1X7LPA7_9BACL|nr:carbohydrate ABC transporter permease [Paenibacillus aquistagni]SMG55708.1 carbohydrate ABC transporter membrane protein 2, CUT1 family [Paenibacillus aquistagni]
MKWTIQWRWRRQKKLNRSFSMDLVLFFILAGAGLFMAVPFVFMISTALKPLDELFLFPPTFFVRSPTLDNFYDLGLIFSNTWVPLSRYMFNTIFVALTGTVGHVILASMAAYPLAKLRLPGGNVLFMIVVLSLMFAPQVTAIPNYLTVSWLGLLDSYWALIFPAIATSLGLFLMKQFMEQIPDALIEAAKIDGASEFRIFWSIVMPMVKPAWLTLIIFSFKGLWGTGSGGQGASFVYSEQLKTMDYAFSQILAGGFYRSGPMAAAALIMMLVPVLIFILTQSSVIQTMSTSGLKD